MKARTFIAAILLIFLAKANIGCLHAQSFAPNVIGSAGTFATSASGSMAWTIGEVMIETYASNGNFFTQGFHQPTKKAMVEISDFFIPEGFSPDGDGINDVFVIRGIQDYPKNSFTIFNRWGDRVFRASPYTGNWDGRSMFGLKVGGDLLPIGTYFYLLDLGDGSAVYKGTIYLNR